MACIIMNISPIAFLGQHGTREASSHIDVLGVVTLTALKWEYKGEFKASFSNHGAFHKFVNDGAK